MSKLSNAMHQQKLASWKQIIIDCRTSGLADAEYMRRHNINKSSFYYWLRLIREELLDEHPECLHPCKHPKKPAPALEAPASCAANPKRSLRKFRLQKLLLSDRKLRLPLSRSPRNSSPSAHLCRSTKESSPSPAARSASTSRKARHRRSSESLPTHGGDRHEASRPFLRRRRLSRLRPHRHEEIHRRPRRHHRAAVPDGSLHAHALSLLRQAR